MTIGDVIVISIIVSTWVDMFTLLALHFYKKNSVAPAQQQYEPVYDDYPVTKVVVHKHQHEYVEKENSNATDTDK